MTEQQRKNAHDLIQKVVAGLEETVKKNKGFRVEIKDEVKPVSMNHSVGGSYHDYAQATITINFVVE